MATSDVVAARLSRTSPAPAIRTAAAFGFGSAMPSKAVGSAELAESLGLTEDWIVDRTGVKSRRYLGDGESLNDLIVSACEEALATAEREAAEIDLFYVATITADNLVPAQSIAAAEALGIPQNAMVTDLNAACTGFVTGLTQAAAMIESGRSNLALVCGADALSRITDYSDPRSAPLFGDGAGAAVVGATTAGFGIGPAIAGHDHQHQNLFANRDDGNLLHMRGRAVYTNAVARICEATEAALAAVDATLADMDLLVVHQANIRIVDAVKERLQLPDEKVSVAIEDVGNTSAATIPIALAAEQRRGRLAAGGLTVLTGFGGGFVWSALAMQLDAIDAETAAPESDR